MRETQSTRHCTNAERSGNGKAHERAVARYVPPLVGVTLYVEPRRRPAGYESSSGMRFCAAQPAP